MLNLKGIEFSQLTFSKSATRLRRSDLRSFRISGFKVKPQSSNLFARVFSLQICVSCKHSGAHKIIPMTLFLGFLQSRILVQSESDTYPDLDAMIIWSFSLKLNNTSTEVVHSRKGPLSERGYQLGCVDKNNLRWCWKLETSTLKFFFDGFGTATLHVMVEDLCLPVLVFFGFCLFRELCNSVLAFPRLKLHMPLPKESLPIRRVQKI